MEKNITKYCTYLNSCSYCSSFTVYQYSGATTGIRWNETCSEYIENNFSPNTKVLINRTGKSFSFNQTRCCQGERTIFYKADESTEELTTFIVTTIPISDSTVTNEHMENDSISFVVSSVNNSTVFQDPRISTAFSASLLLSVVIAITAVLLLLMILCVLVTLYKRRSKRVPGHSNPVYSVANEIKSDGIAEYSTVEECAFLMTSLTEQKNTTKSGLDNYFILEKNEKPADKVEENPVLKDPLCSKEEIYNKLHEGEQCKGLEENPYSHVGDFDNEVYNTVLRR